MELFRNLMEAMPIMPTTGPHRFPAVNVENRFPILAAALWSISLVLLGFMLTLPGAAPSWADDESRYEIATVTAGRLAGDETSVRFFIDLDRKPDLRTFLMTDPARVVIDGPPMAFRFANPDDIAPRGLVSFVRYGAVSRERSRIVLTLASPAEISSVSIREIEPAAKYRLVLDLQAIDDIRFQALVEEQQKLVGSSGESAVKGDRLRRPEPQEGRFVVVIDPGHGGIDGGAVGADGTEEKELTLAVARQIAERLESLGPFDVKLTRDSDIFLSLRERVNFARRNHADLMISIHADSLRQKWVRGASVYTLSRRASDELARELAESENMADIVAGLDNPSDENVVTDILADLTARETKVFSRSFSSTVVRFLSTDVKMLKNPQRSADFVVLKAPEIPGALIELGYMSNPDDEKLLTDPEWQSDIARLLAKAIYAFFKPRM